MDGICSTCTKDVIIPFVSAILGIAIPLLIGVIQRIDDKYSSTRMIKQFAKEKVVLFFITFLILTIIFLFLVPNMPLPSNRYEGWGYIKHGFPLLFSYGFCILSIISFFRLTYYVYLYNNPDLIQKRLIDNLEDEETRKTWWEFFNYLHTTDNIDAVRLGHQCLEDLCGKYQKKSRLKVIVYPADIYEGVLSINETLCCRQKKVVSKLDRFDVIQYLFDNKNYSYISDTTFYTISICLSQQLYYKRGDWFLRYWGRAQEYLQFTLVPLYVNMQFDESIITTKDMVKKREKERKQFLDFHVVLGASLLSKKEYTLLKQVLYFTNTQPPQYLLIPSSLSEIIVLFMELLSSPLWYFPNFKNICYIPELTGDINNESYIEVLIQKYLALLIIRLYTLHPEYSYKSYFDSPGLPDRISEKENWIDNFQDLKKRVEEVCDADWLSDVLDDFVEFTTKEKVKLDILKILDDMEERSQNEIKDQKRSRKISTDEVDRFNEMLITGIKSNIVPYLKISLGQLDKLEEKGMQAYSLVGFINEIRPLDLFAEEKEVHHVNFREILVNSFVGRFVQYYENTFSIYSSRHYRIFSDDISRAISLLDLNSDNHVLLGFGVDCRNLFEDISSSSENKYLLSNGLEFYNLPSTRSSLLSNYIAVIHRDDIPKVIIEEPKENLIKKYHLECIDENYKVYTSIVKLGDDQDLIDEITQSANEDVDEDNLQESVLVYAMMNARICWKSDSNVVLIKILYQFLDSGDDNLDEVKPFKMLRM
jgi:hypothetical protein